MFAEAVFKIAAAVVMAPLYALFGALRLMAWLCLLPGHLSNLHRLLGRGLCCPSCGRENALSGRWSCARCSGVYHGFVGECPICSARASFFPCMYCGVSIVLEPWQ
jgi:hypothetical protein